MSTVIVEAQRQLRAGSGNLDAALWALATVLVLFLIPIGWVSGDGLVYSIAYDNGTWSWNPNHLLMQPVGAWWHQLLVALGSTRSGPDQQKLLSAVAGAIAIGLFHWRLASRVAASRFAANHATAWVAFSSAFARYLISDKTHMVQMPFLVLAAIALWVYLNNHSVTWALVAGLALGGATLFLVSNIVVAAALAAAVGWLHLTHREWRRAALGVGALGVGAGGVAGLGLWLAWFFLHSPRTGFLRWVMAYGGGEGMERVAGSYGVKRSLVGVATAGARSVYGAASATVDLAPVIEFWRDGQGSAILVGLNVCAALAAAVAILLVISQIARRAPSRPEWELCALAIAWAAATLLFGVFWDNSDDMFFFQLAVPIAALVALLRPGRRLRTVVVLSACALSWNTVDIVRTYVLYPRFERIAALRSAVAEAGLIIFPGYDEVDHLLLLMGVAPSQRLPITALATRYPFTEGMEHLRQEVRATLARGRRVAVVSIFDVPDQRNPWKYVGGLGYEHGAIIAVLSEFSIANPSRSSAPFTVRWISEPSPPPGPKS